MSIINEIAQALSMPPSWVKNVIARSPYSYKTYYVKKRNGGLREISQPARETKAVQYWFLQKYEHQLNVHNCATAYIKGKNIYDNAKAHSNSKYLAKFDFNNFFPSITESDIYTHIKTSLGEEISESDTRILSRLVCKKERLGGTAALTIGSPTSPLLSNSIMFEFDSTLHSFCKENNFLYTRYADDITVSSNEKGKLFQLTEIIQSILDNLKYPTLSINSSKTIYLSKKYQRRVTGLTLTNDGEISLGRKKKRELSTLIHLFSLQKLQPKEIEKLQGFLAYANSVEPSFIIRMRRKYGAFVIGQLL